MRRSVVSHRAQGDGTEVFHFSLENTKSSISLPGSLIEMLSARHQSLGETKSAYIKRLIIEDLQRAGITWTRDRWLKDCPRNRFTSLLDDRKEIA
jgi:hypothetical protein